MVALGSFFHFVWSDSTLSCKRIESTHHGLSNAVLKNFVRLLVIFIKFDEFWSRLVENHKKTRFVIFCEIVKFQNGITFERKVGHISSTRRWKAQI